MYLIFDTSIVIELERGNREVITRINDLKKDYPLPARLSFISYFEFLQGIHRRSDKNKDKSIAFIDKFNVMTATKLTAKNLSLLKNKYEFPLADLIIAAQVMDVGGALVTRDKDFSKIGEIKKVVLD